MIFKSESGKVAYKSEFLQFHKERRKHYNTRKICNRVFLVAAFIWFALCLHGVFCETVYYGVW